MSKQLSGLTHAAPRTSKKLILSRGQFALVGPSDFKSASKFKWSADKNGMGGFYAVRRNADKKVYLHRFLMGNPVGMKVDHKNHNTLDCRRSNLRVCSSVQNGQNRKGPNYSGTSGVRNVTWSKSSKKWLSRICVNGKSIHLGSYSPLSVAAAVSKKAIIKNFGSFCGRI